nr:unnamed protein product [Spirometra erinaceieuropaei]
MAAAQATVSHITNRDTTTDTTPTFTDCSDEDQEYTCPHCSSVVRISLLFCQRYKGASKIPQTRGGPPASVISQVQSLLANPPADAPYSALKAEILRLNSVSDRQRYHQLIKEESLGDRKPSELLRRMRCLLGDMQVDDKFVKEMFLERLPTDVQTILASGSQDLTVSQLAEMADRMIEVKRFQSPSVAQISSSSSVNEHLLKQVSAMVDEMASLKIQLARLTSSRSRSRRRSRSRPQTADTCWYHTNFGVKARRCSSPCSFKPKQGNQSARE